MSTFGLVCQNGEASGLKLKYTYLDELFGLVEIKSVTAADQDWDEFCHIEFINPDGSDYDARKTGTFIPMGPPVAIRTNVGTFWTVGENQYGSFVAATQTVLPPQGEDQSKFLFTFGAAPDPYTSNYTLMTADGRWLKCRRWLLNENLLALCFSDDNEDSDYNVFSVYSMG